MDVYVQRKQSTGKALSWQDGVLEWTMFSLQGGSNVESRKQDLGRFMAKAWGSPVEGRGGMGPGCLAHPVGLNGNWVLGFDLNYFVSEFQMNLIYFDKEILLNIFNKIWDN
jgi:hypothetical protein